MIAAHLINHITSMCVAGLAQDVVVPAHGFVHKLRALARQLAKVLDVSNHDAYQYFFSRLGHTWRTLGALGLRRSRWRECRQVAGHYSRQVAGHS